MSSLKGSIEAKLKMANLRARKKTQNGTSDLKIDKKVQALPVGKRTSPKGSIYYEYRANETDKGRLLGIGSVFDTSVIKEVDDLKKQYFKLAKKYHPDMGGTTIQFQALQKDYEDLLKKLLAGSSLNSEQKTNEIIIDKAIRDIIDILISFENINIEVIGKWLWISGNTYPIKDILKGSGMFPIKKNNVFYWVYKGSDSKGKGNMTIEEIKKKYGSQNIPTKPSGKISGIKLTLQQKNRLKSYLYTIQKGLNKRPI